MINVPATLIFLCFCTLGHATKLKFDISKVYGGYSTDTGSILATNLFDCISEWSDSAFNFAFQM